MKNALQERLTYLYQELESLDESQKELKQTIRALEEVKTGEVLTPLAQGIFIKSRVENPEFVISVGSGVAVKANKKKAKELLENQMQELEEIGQQISTQLEEGMQELEALHKNV